MNAKKRASLGDILRGAIVESGKSQNEIARESGVAQAIVNRFVTGQRGLTLDTADRLCEVLGLVLVAAE